jgi:hypothetical protein
MIVSRWASNTVASVRVGADDDENVVLLREKIRALVARRYGNSFVALFNHYGAHGADHAALVQLLEDADVGNIFTRGLWADGVMKRVDANHDGLISWEEFASIVSLPSSTGHTHPEIPSAAAPFVPPAPAFAAPAPAPPPLPHAQAPALAPLTAALVESTPTTTTIPATVTLPEVGWVAIGLGAGAIVFELLRRLGAR